MREGADGFCSGTGNAVTGLGFSADPVTAFPVPVEAAAGFAVPFADPLRVSTTAPTASLSPGLTAIWSTVPAASAAMGMLALSVSTSISS